MMSRFHPFRSAGAALCVALAALAAPTLVGPAGADSLGAAPAPTTPPAVKVAPYVVPSTVPLPIPIAPPDDPESSEPVVERGRIAIAAIDLDRPLYEGIRLPTFDLGPGHWPGTAQPGQPGNVVIGGHRTSGNADFRNLDQLEAGDEMVITDLAGNQHRYTVGWTEITGPFSTRVVTQTQATTATLFACHPVGSTSQRIVVHLDAVVA